MYVHIIIIIIIIIISTIPSFILVLAMEEQWDGKHFITDCKTDQRQKEV
jgi:hypothetical protein